MRVALIAKPLTGPRNKANDILHAVDQLAACHIHCEVFETQYHAHALQIVQGLPLSQFDALIAMGGDGTNYHLLNGALKFHGDRPIPPLGIIPVGRGNSFGKDLHIHSIADGCFDVVILSPLSRFSLITTFPKIFKGTHLTNPRVRVLRGIRAVVQTVPKKGLLPDGEMFGTTPTTITVLPRRVRYFAGM